jgi:transposase
VDKIVDLSFIREMTEGLYCKGNGRPSIDPELFFRMMLIEYFYGIKSDRQLCEEIQYNLAFRWFCRLGLHERVPDHSSLTRIRDRLGEASFEKIFQKIVRVCIERGLVKGKGLMTDGSLVRADASLDSIRRKDRKDVDPNGNDSRAERISRIKGWRIDNATHESVSDPDASLAGKKGQGTHLFYKAHHSIDSDSRVILDPFVTTGNVHETTVYTARIDAIEQTFGIKFEEAVADRAYGSAENLTYFREHGIRPIVPLLNNRAGQGTRRSEAEGFRYDKKQDCYICPEGERLTHRSTSREIRIYASPKAICAACPRFESCLSEAERAFGRGKMIRRNEHQKLYEWAHRRERTWVFKKISNERMWKMEGIWAEAKNFHGFTRAKYRGRAKVQIQAYMTASCQNIKRLLKAFIRDFTRRWENFGRQFRISVRILRLIPTR